MKPNPQKSVGTNRSARKSIADEDWMFIQGDVKGCSEDEKPILFRYELAREGYFCERSESPEFLLFRSLFPEFFPQTAYLAIPCVLRKERWESTFGPKDGSIPRFDMQAPDTGFWWHRFPIPRDGFEPSSPEEQAAISDEEMEKSIALLQIRLDLNYSDKTLVDAFQRMLSSVREGYIPSREKETRGQTSLQDALKQLASYRLLRL